MSKPKRIVLAIGVIAAAFPPAAKALALGGQKHNEVLLEDR